MNLGNLQPMGVKVLTTVRIKKNVHFPLHLWKRFSWGVFTLESKSLPQLDCKFHVDSENMVTFEI